MKRMAKKGQVAIFVILAVVIVGVILFLLFLNPGTKVTSAGGEFNPSSFLKSCIEPELKTGVETLSKNAGYPEVNDAFITYRDEKIKYLCYTSEFYKPCVIQQPLIKENFERELNKIIASKANACAEDLKREYEKRGYSVSASRAESTVEVVQDKIKIKFSAPMTITKDDTRTFREFNVEMRSSIYELLMTATSIVDFEATYGNSETTTYMQYYPELKIEKIQLSDGTRVYKLTNVITKDQFIFASRSIAWPPGYGL